MACSMSSSVVWGSCSCPAAGLRRVSSVSSFRCGLEQLESGIAPPHSAIPSSEDFFRRWRASCVPVQTQVAKDKAACQRREAFGVSRRSLLGLVVVALPPAVALAEEEVENESQRLFRQMKTSVLERVGKQERERAVVGAAAPPPSTEQEPVPTADASPEAELEPETEPDLEPLLLEPDLELSPPETEPDLELSPPETEPDLELSLPETEPDLELSLPETEPDLELSLPETEPDLELSLPETEPDLELSLPETEPDLELSLPETEPDLELSLPETEPDLEISLPETKPDLDLSLPETEPCTAVFTEPDLELLLPETEPFSALFILTVVIGLCDLMNLLLTSKYNKKGHSSQTVPRELKQQKPASLNALDIV